MILVERAKQWLAAASMGQKVIVALGISLLVGTVVAVVLWSTRPNYQVLFSRLNPEDGASIVETLKQEKISYKLRGNGTVILVPDEKVYELRLSLASAGIPQGGGVGFEIFDDTPMGTTEFVQMLNYQRAIQGELSRTIAQFEAVAHARVHIVTPKGSLFVEDEKPATASVVLRLLPGEQLSKRQIDGVVRLVSSAVEGLDPDNITVVDVNGGVLHKGHRSDSEVALSSSQLEHQNSLETSLERRIQEMLERVVGDDRAVVRVTAEVDYRQITTNEERFDPDSAVIRSEQRQQESSVGGTTMPEGAPEEKYEFGRSGGQGMVSNNSSKKQNQVINYEINRVSKQTVAAVGEIKRLSVAVVVDGKYEAVEDAAGEVSQSYVARSQEEMKRLVEIVKKAMGYDSKRGDQVEVINLPFAEQPQTLAEGGEGASAWMSYVARFAPLLLKVVVVLLVFLFVVRPLMRWLSQVSSRPQAGQTSGELALESPTPEALSALEPRQRVMYLAKNDPEKTTDLIRGWLNEKE
jgi:flagellar M-ring protein FliF